MRIPERGSGWSGLLIAVCTSALLQACASLPMVSGSTAHLEYALRVQEASAAERAEMWSTDSSSGVGTTSRLQRALLQSHPGHPGYDKAAAQAGLEQLAGSEANGVAPVARLRLAELRAADECRAQVDALKQRLARVADIERSTAPR